MENNSIIRVSEIEQYNNTKLLESFCLAYAANDAQSIRGMLCDQGLFFGKYNKEIAAGIFYKIFFGDKGISNNYDLTIRNGYSVDYYPGEIVIEFRSSNLNPYSDDQSNIDNSFGAKPNECIQEIVHRFAFYFSSGKISSIRRPRKCVSKDSLIHTLN